LKTTFNANNNALYVAKHVFTEYFSRVLRIGRSLEKAPLQKRYKRYKRYKNIHTPAEKKRGKYREKYGV